MLDPKTELCNNAVNTQILPAPRKLEALVAINKRAQLCGRTGSTVLGWALVGCL